MYMLKYFYILVKSFNEVFLIGGFIASTFLKLLIIPLYIIHVQGGKHVSATDVFLFPYKHPILFKYCRSAPSVSHNPIVQL